MDAWIDVSWSQQSVAWSSSSRWRRGEGFLHWSLRRKRKARGRTSPLISLRCCCCRPSSTSLSSPSPFLAPTRLPLFGSGLHWELWAPFAALFLIFRCLLLSKVGCFMWSTNLVPKIQSRRSVGSIPTLLTINPNAWGSPIGSWKLLFASEVDTMNHVCVKEGSFLDFDFLQQKEKKKIGLKYTFLD